jgi:hypothetical protein
VLRKEKEKEKMKLSISIMAHPSRAQYFDYLTNKLGGVSWSIDEGIGLLANCRRAWTLYDPTADYHCVIQDDCIICDNFWELAEKVCEKANGLAVSFFYSQSKFYNKFKKERAETGAIVKKGLYGGLAICLPVKLIPAMLEFYDKQKIPFDDHRINLFCMANKINIYSPFPCLVDHRQGHMSVFTKSLSKCQAAEYIDRDK